MQHGIFYAIYLGENGEEEAPMVKEKKVEDMIECMMVVDDQQ